eukprot:CAMPEP_0182441562 /NCGR_PEP_ID=MMETSP1172-20130603/533_1 /TAXON_ID=708627 /ORGANISM="Timspurckia oligopyrenoides, Strain CCMP3278" /LENGTH=243 /DNA_ID=CAMNT_0024635919 /DNA_START=155 /DNA_END=886 /DNA_ORIENTATION=+
MDVKEQSTRVRKREHVMDEDLSEGKRMRWTSPLSDVLLVKRPSVSFDEVDVLNVSDSLAESCTPNLSQVEDKDDVIDVSFLEPDMGFDELVGTCARYLKGMVSESGSTNPRSISPSENISVFYSAEKQKFSLDSYLKRVVTLVNESSSVCFAALVYLKRLSALDSRLRLNDYNVHRIFMTAFVLASKMLEDEVYSNEHYARVGGIPSLLEMNKLEACMLSLLDFNLYISPEEYESTLSDTDSD